MVDYSNLFNTILSRCPDISNPCLDLDTIQKGLGYLLKYWLILWIITLYTSVSNLLGAGGRWQTDGARSC